ncbi:MAG TPA: tRNA lysidine(34) synthetase TilS [Opitutaceae bacterium]|nr:tRNA lysidine(34) synthetase TilS [Opitutaceae bacterium]
MTFPRPRLHPAVLAWAGKSPPRARWSIAFSGGADSLVLLLLVWAHWPARRTRFQALHFNHRLRGRESQSDEKFCRKVCAALGVKLICGSWSGARKGASEAEARVARHDFFAKNSRALWLGHQQDDIAETMLMRIARGSGTAGLAAPRPVQARPGGRVHLRPLLTVKKSEIIAALRTAGISWREDSSNAGAAFFRNRVRREVLPAWSAASERDALAGAARARELLEEDDAALELWLAELEPLEKSGLLRLAKLSGKPRAILRRALHRWLLAQPAAGELSRQAFELLLDAIVRAKPTRQSLGSQGFAVIRAGCLSFEFVGKRRGKFQRGAN